MNTSNRPAVDAADSFARRDAISLAGGGERHGRANNPHTIFTWWARRPFSSMSGLIAAACSRAASDESTNTRPLNVLDLFAGGATIPLEAARAGHIAVAVDNNELAHFINVALLTLTQNTQVDVPQLVELHGRAVLERLEYETRDMFPLRESNPDGLVGGYFWSRSMKCLDCGASLSLQKRPWLAKRRGKSILIKRSPDHLTRGFSIAVDEGGTVASDTTCWQGSSVECPFCGRIYKRSEIGKAVTLTGFDEATAYYVVRSNRSGKAYYPLADSSLPLEVIEKSMASDLKALGESLPSVEMPRWSGIANPALYGHSRYADLFNKRQLAVLVKCCRLIREQHRVIREQLGAQVADTVTSILSGLLDQLVDWNCRICMWIPQNEQVGRGLSGPGLPMMWDFVETDPMANGPANLTAKLERLVSGLREVPQFHHVPIVLKGDARELPFPDDSFDFIVTDPPYFDNIFYHVLADCIYVWKRLALRPIFPEIFDAPSTNQTRELTASKDREGSKKAAAEYYTDGLTKILTEARRVLRPGGSLTLVFAHSCIDGWASVLQSFSHSGFKINAAWPLRVERRLRPRSMTSKAVNTCFALEATIGEQGDQYFVQLADLAAVKMELTQIGYAGDDLGHALFGIGVAAISRSSGDAIGEGGVDPEVLLEELHKIVADLVPGFSMERR